MEMILKTKEVSEQLGVNPTTVQRWAKYFGLNCETNEYGHYLFSLKHVEAMRQVQQQLQEGKMMKEVDISPFVEKIMIPKEQATKNIDPIRYEEKLEEVLDRVNDLEKQLTRKADEVVSYQLLKHRSELEEMTKVIKKLERRLTEMENKIQDESAEEIELPAAIGGAPKRKWRTLMQLFTF